MKMARGAKLVLAALVSLNAPLVLAQNPIATGFTMDFGNVSELKQKAEDGDAQAQVKLAGLYTSIGHNADAFALYQKAAAQGDGEAAYQISQMLLFGAWSGIKDQGIEPNPAEGIKATFQLASHFEPRACHNMVQAYRQGLGVAPDPVRAYAWLQIYTGTQPSGLIPANRMELNQMALTMDVDSLRRAEQLAAQYKAGNWESPVILYTPPPSPPAERPRTLAEALARQSAPPPQNGVIVNLKLKAITGSMAVINDRMIGEGETAKVTVKSGRVSVKCLKIQTNSVVISVEGEDAPRTLYF
jgi:hypothetical protein